MMVSASVMRLICLALLFAASAALADAADGGTPSVREEVRKALSSDLPMPRMPATLPSTAQDARLQKAPVPADRVAEQARERAAVQAGTTTSETLRATTLQLAEDAARTATSNATVDLRSAATQQVSAAAAQSTNGEVAELPVPGTPIPEGAPTDIPTDLPTRPTGNPRR